MTLFSHVSFWSRATLLALFILVFLGLGFFFRDKVGQVVWRSVYNDELALFISSDDLALKRIIASHYFNGGAYDLNKAEKYYRELYDAGERDRLTLYQLGRIHFANSRFSAAFQILDLQLELFPEQRRAYYMLGLTNIYMERFEKAAHNFEIFVEWAPDEWAGYNDLAWAYFKNEDFQKTVEVAMRGLERFPDNMWLHNMAGLGFWNLGNFLWQKNI